MRWKKKPLPDRNTTEQLARKLGVDELIATLLVQRGISGFEEARHFFRPSLSDLHDPFLMKDMDKAVARIEKAVSRGEKILVYGDYDVDGTTSVALMSSYLNSFYPGLSTYIPDRYDEGYGVSYKGIDHAAGNGISLIIALDCGIKATDKIAYAAAKGIEFIVCDHHRPGAELPPAVAVLDPKRPDCNYPYDELCGCGVGFKLIQALASRKGQPVESLLPYLDLVATAIGADIVPMTGENRVLAYLGLKQINSAPRPGIKALTGSLDKKQLSITDVVFVIAPRINAAGRIKHGLHAVELLTETDTGRAAAFAAGIEQFNQDRKQLDKDITEEALQQIARQGEQDRHTTVVCHESWHKGVIGIVASRLTETYYRPTLVFTRTGDRLAASARSVKGFDVYNALEQCADCIEQFGGHKYAAGLTLLPEQYENFKQKFETVVSRTITPELLIPEIAIDMQITLNDITPKCYRILKQFAPFGPGNPAPVFLTEGLEDTGYGKTVGENGKHLKVSVRQGDSPVFGGIGFNLGDKHSLIRNRNPFSAVYSVDENHWNGSVSLQLKLYDIK
ncbi:single-stranded-DNA-specific exonuclease RecJ [Sinomicrobium soli]|uniref:single-stranded-DNA-specific exonuclease RecJ n=1 Tax=Sinomicrobium sp. N-1-3-6 TaxID=2219864 RepID=UPI000DCF51DB|nr:single-stranded-DNA-specific exonuclease RecJ [Sinomicrobium sp. N-1-3-6]RAV27573.1 single-stranded-DNA-specific exonuclease RecJ [Sinomicrobium sp. N-1-3-6]